MQKVTAYMAENGRLFLDDKKCSEYEKKLEKYPKMTEEVEQVEANFDGSRFPIYKHTFKYKVRYNVAANVREIYEIRNGEISYYVYGHKNVIWGMVNDLKQGNIFQGVGNYIRELIIFGSSPFSDCFVTHLQNGINSWNEKIEKQYRHGTNRIVLKREIVNDGNVAVFTFPNACGAFPSNLVEITTNKDYIIKKLFKLE